MKENAGTGAKPFLFGAYTAVSWPKPSGGNVYSTVDVADASRTSFLFSLTNELGTPFHLILSNASSTAVRASYYDVTYGWEDLELLRQRSPEHSNCIFRSAARYDASYTSEDPSL